MAIDWNQMRSNLGLADATQTVDASQKSNIDWEQIRQRIGSQPAQPDNGFKLNMTPVQTPDPFADMGTKSTTSMVPPQNPTIDKAEKVLSDWYAKPGPAQAGIKAGAGMLEDLNSRFENAKKIALNPKSSFVEQLSAGANLGLGLVQTMFLPGVVGIEAAANADATGANALNLPLQTVKLGAQVVKGGFDLLGKGVKAANDKAYEHAPDFLQPFKPVTEEGASLIVMMLAGEALHLSTKGAGELVKSVGEIKDVNGVVRSAANVLNIETKTDLLGRVRKPTIEDLNTRFRRAAQETHPDKGGTPEAFQTVTTAKKVLQDYIELPRKEFTAKWNAPLEAVKKAVSGYLAGDVTTPPATGFDAEFSRQLSKLDGLETSSRVVEQPNLDPNSIPTERMLQPSEQMPTFNGKEINTTEIIKYEPMSNLPAGTSVVQMRDMHPDLVKNIPTATDPTHLDKATEVSTKLEEYRQANTEKVFDVPAGNGKSLASIEVVPYADGKFTVKTEANTSGTSLFRPHDTVYSTRTQAIEAAKGQIMDFANRAVSKAGSKSELVQLKTIVDAVTAHKTVPVEQAAPVAKIELVQNPTTPEETALAARQDRIMGELVLAEKGSRFFVDSSVTGSEMIFGGTKSTFPKWIPEELRRKPLLDSVSTHIADGTLPTKAAELRLYEVVRREMMAQELAKQFVDENQDIPFFTAEENAAWASKELTKLYDETRTDLQNQGEVGDIAAVDATSVPAGADAAHGTDQAIQEAQGNTAKEFDRVFQELKQIPKGVFIDRPTETLKAPYRLPSDLLSIVGAKDADIFFTRRSMKHLAEKGVEGERLFKLASKIITKPDEIRRGELDNRFLFSKTIADVKLGRPQVVNLEVSEKGGNLIVTAFQANPKYLSDFELLWRTADPRGPIPPSAYPSPSEANAGSRTEFSALKEAQSPKATGDIRTQNTEVVNPTKSGVGKSIEAKAIEKGLSTGFEGTAEYTPVTIKDQAVRAAELLGSDMERAKRIIKGEERLPDGMLAGTLIKAMEDYAMETRNAALALDIANSPLTAETSIHAQEMRMLAERTPDSAVVNIKILKKMKEEAARKTGETKKSVADDIKEEVKKSKPKATKETWASFIDSITCK